MSWKLGLTHRMLGSKSHKNNSRVCIVGNGEKGRILQNLFRDQKHGVLVGLVSLSDEELCKSSTNVPPISILGSLSELDTIARENKVQRAIIAVDTQEYDLLLDIGNKCQRSGLSVCFASELLSRVSKYIMNGKARDMNLPMLLFPLSRRRLFWETGKRIFDILLSLSTIILTSPIWFVGALAIKITSPGPVFYRREVVGKNGRTFNFYKFRTMRHNNDDAVHREYMKELITNGAKRETYKIVKDSRITFIGRILRRFSMDELPQFLNVLKGDMSVIGPRPCNTDEYQYYKEWQKRRTEVRPGITGLWQVKARSSVNYDEMVMLDLYYIHNRSYLLDLRIALETVLVMLSGKGAY